ncbi:Spc97/Spc98 family protein [Verticillium alfalfae VaMs.102]|uniref:Spindle pole body component n=1 Tax=Verticillium alfalfae (strain VaMs.102 / ATCC MYA-4576 / FGSC 10136) TaxID=526221 RepID=C9SUN9_VERA1|nr:Spc97/Spc98 family protein [Verticillium alfalfae VaMs.102]EEY22149.1 Spc97/Spc98 family protein [Verticillium alfalfae VaMs.102]
MLHEILLSLSGHPSPLLRTDGVQPTAFAAISPPERELLATAAHLSDLNIKLLGHSAQISAEHPSTICRAVATAIESIHLAAFQRKVLEVEETVLRHDSSLVGAYNIVPLTAVIGEFSGWTRRLEWLREVVQFILGRHKGGKCCGAQLIDRLRTELQSGYMDIEQTALTLVKVAETAWLKQVSAWILYGRLPSHGEGDFFVRLAEDGDHDFVITPTLLPKFVTPTTAASMLFIGKSLNHVRVKSSVDSGLMGLDHLSSQLRELSGLAYPLNTASFSRAITALRVSLSRTTLQKLLPLSRVVEILRLLREFFLLGRAPGSQRAPPYSSSQKQRPISRPRSSPGSGTGSTNGSRRATQSMATSAQATLHQQAEPRHPETTTTKRGYLAHAFTASSRRPLPSSRSSNSNSNTTRNLSRQPTHATPRPLPPPAPHVDAVHGRLLTLLVSTDHLVALVHRLHSIWTSMDLEADAGVVDAFVDLETEERSVAVALRDVEGRVKAGIEDVIAALRILEADSSFAEGLDGGSATDEMDGVWGAEEGEYTPRRVGGVERLLMKLDFGGWFGGRKGVFGDVV